MKLVTVIVGVLLFALATMIIYGWGIVKQKNESQDLMNLLFSKGESKVKKYLKNHVMKNSKSFLKNLVVLYLIIFIKKTLIHVCIILNF